MDRQQSMVAIGLEAGPGLVLQTFGIGHLYAGKIGTGLAIMVSYWLLQAINVMLMPFFIGWITFPLTFLIYMVMAPTNLISSKRRDY